MKNGYKIFWTSHALLELETTIAYLQENWSERELKKFSRELEHTIELISRNPKLFPNPQLKQEVHRAVVARYNNLYYKIPIKRSYNLL